MPLPHRLGTLFHGSFLTLLNIYVIQVTVLYTL